MLFLEFNTFSRSFLTGLVSWTHINPSYDGNLYWLTTWLYLGCWNPTASATFRLALCSCFYCPPNNSMVLAIPQPMLTITMKRKLSYAVYFHTTWVTTTAFETFCQRLPWESIVKSIPFTYDLTLNTIKKLALFYIQFCLSNFVFLINCHDWNCLQLLVDDVLEICFK